MADDYRPDPVQRADGGSIATAPFWSSYWLDSDQLTDRSKTPAPPARLLKQDPGRVSEWAKKTHGLESVIISTDHAVLVLFVDPMAAKHFSRQDLDGLRAHFPGKLGRTLTRPQVAHLLALRYLRLEAQWRRLICLDPAAKPHLPAKLPGHFGALGRSELYLFAKKEPYMEFGRHFFGGAGANASYWYHSETETVIGAFHAEGLKPAEMLARFDHLVAHDLVYQFRSFYHYVPAWIPHGIAHYFARRNKAVRNTYVIVGSPAKEHAAGWRWDPDGKRSGWEREARTLVRKGQSRPLLELGREHEYQQLHPRIHVQAWSMVDYMVAVSRSGFRTFLDEIMTKGEDESMLEVQQRAFMKGYGVNMVEFEKHWKAWVLRNKIRKRGRR